MADRFIVLTCQNCGAKLDVYDDMTRFGCSYCGFEMLVERRGGTVSLKAVEEAIEKVQISTDKTAAELALVRLKQELIAKEREISSLALQSGRTTWGCFGTIGFAITLSFVGAIADSTRDTSLSAWLLAITVAAGGPLLFWLHHQGKKQSAKRLAGPLATAKIELEELKRQIEKSREVANS